jgi:hypothetical protein
MAECAGSSAMAACVEKARPRIGGLPEMPAGNTIRPGMAPATKPSRAAFCCT